VSDVSEDESLPETNYDESVFGRSKASRRSRSSRQSGRSGQSGVSGLSQSTAGRLSAANSAWTWATSVHTDQESSDDDDDQTIDYTVSSYDDTRDANTVFSGLTSKGGERSSVLRSGRDGGENVETIARNFLEYWRCENGSDDQLGDDFEVPLKVVLVAKATVVHDVSSRRGGRPTLHYNYDTGIKFVEDGSHRAVVKEVSLGSEAFQAEVLKNDVIQFAVALNNVDPNSHVHFELAKKLALQLEGMGMRTSYREVFDMFHSNTTAGWPIAFVFRRPTLKEKKR